MMRRPCRAALPGRLPPQFAAVDILVNNAGLALGTSSVARPSVAFSST